MDKKTDDIHETVGLRLLPEFLAERPDKIEADQVSEIFDGSEWYQPQAASMTYQMRRAVYEDSDGNSVEIVERFFPENDISDLTVYGSPFSSIPSSEYCAQADGSYLLLGVIAEHKEAI